MTLERPPSFTFDRAHLLSGFGGVYLANAIVAFLFSASAPVAIILAASQRGGLSEADIASGCSAASSSTASSLAFASPTASRWCCTGRSLARSGRQALDHLSCVIGAYYATGADAGAWTERMDPKMHEPVADADRHGDGGRRLPAIRPEPDLRDP
jgi:benzoate membrane transport protein